MLTYKNFADLSEKNVSNEYKEERKLWKGSFWESVEVEGKIAEKT